MDSIVLSSSLVDDRLILEFLRRPWPRLFARELLHANLQIMKRWQIHSIELQRKTRRCLGHTGCCTCHPCSDGKIHHSRTLLTRQAACSAP